MSTSTNSTDPSRTSDEQLDSKFLARFTDTDALFVRPSTVSTSPRGGTIALERFQQLEQNIRNTPASPEPYVELGRIYISQDRLADARRVLDLGANACAEYEPLLVLREDLILHQANQMADQARTQHAHQHTEESKYALEQAEINYANERIRVCRDRFARHPEQLDILVNWAIALRQLARFDEAIDLLRKAAAQPELRARANLQLGMCYQTLGRPLDALSSFRRASLCREPPPEPKIRNRALELAMEIAEDLSLIDSARFYAEELLKDSEPAKRPGIEARLQKLRALEL